MWKICLPLYAIIFTFGLDSINYYIFAEAESTIVDFRETLEQTLEQTQDVTTSQPLSGEVPKVDDSSAIQELKQVFLSIYPFISPSPFF